MMNQAKKPQLGIYKVTMQNERLKERRQEVAAYRDMLERRLDYLAKEAAEVKPGEELTEK